MFNILVVKALKSRRDYDLNRKIGETMDKFMREKDVNQARIYLEELKELKEIEAQSRA